MFKQLDNFDLDEEQYNYITDSLEQITPAFQSDEYLTIDYDYYEDETQEIMYSVNLRSTDPSDPHTRTVCYIAR